jgi:hypothetical protein
MKTHHFVVMNGVCFLALTLDTKPSPICTYHSHGEETCYTNYGTIGDKSW